MPPSPPPQGRSLRLVLALGASLFATLWLAGWSHAATGRVELNGWGRVNTASTDWRRVVSAWSKTQSASAFPLDSSERYRGSAGDAFLRVKPVRHSNEQGLLAPWNAFSPLAWKAAAHAASNLELLPFLRLSSLRSSGR